MCQNDNKEYNTHTTINETTSHTQRAWYATLEFNEILL